MKLSIQRRRWILVALPLLLGVALWRAPYYAIGKMQVFIGTYTNHDLARKDALRKLSLLLQTYPFKNELIVTYTYFGTWEMSYERPTQIFTNGLEAGFGPGSFPNPVMYQIAPGRIERAAKWNQTSRIGFVYPRS